MDHKIRIALYGFTKEDLDLIQDKDDATLSYSISKLIKAEIERKLEKN